MARVVCVSYVAQAHEWAGRCVSIPTHGDQSVSGIALYTAALTRESVTDLEAWHFG